MAKTILFLALIACLFPYNLMSEESAPVSRFGSAQIIKQARAATETKPSLSAETETKKIPLSRTGSTALIFHRFKRK